MFSHPKFPFHLLKPHSVKPHSVKPHSDLKISAESSQTVTPSAGKAVDSAKKPSMLEQFMPFAFILIIVYFLFIRPQQKRAQKHLKFTKNLKIGDSILTSGGVLGKVDGLTDQYVILMVSDNVKIRVLRSHVSSFSDTQKSVENKKSSATPS